MFFLLDPVKEGADNFLGEIGGVASWSVGAEVSGQSEREREREMKSAVHFDIITKAVYLS